MEKFFFKKVEMWVLLLVVLVCLIGAVVFGIAVRYESKGKSTFGMFGKAAIFLAKIPENLKRGLEGDTKGLVVGKKRFAGKRGLVMHNQAYNFPGDDYLLLVSRYDGDKRRSVVELLNLKSQQVVHNWEPDIELINSKVEKSREFKNIDRDHGMHRYRMIHPMVFEDGSLMFQSNSPIVKIDACSNLIFQNSSDKFHHAIERDSEGDIWVSVTVHPSTIKGFWSNYADDAITKISPVDGKILYQKSVTQILLDHDLQHEMYTYDKRIRDPIHLNDIQPVDQDGPYWKKGDVFISLGHLNMVALFRPATDRLIWWTQLKMNHQHDIDILNDHEISIFDNNRVMGRRGDVVKGTNEILIYDFHKDELRSVFKDSMVKYKVRTKSQGLNEFLPGGGVFIEETAQGRLLALDQNGEMIWEYINRASDDKIYALNWSRILFGEEAVAIASTLAETNC